MEFSGSSLASCQKKCVIIYLCEKKCGYAQIYLFITLPNMSIYNTNEYMKINIYILIYLLYNFLSLNNNLCSIIL